VIDAEWVRARGDRRTGIGFDQLLVLGDDERPEIDACVAIWNADGSRAEQCGNGMRAIGLYLSSRDGEPERDYRVRTPVADISLRHLGDEQVRVEMGEPAFDPHAVPLEGPIADDTGAYTLAIGEGPVRFGALSMGNPHAVIEVEDVNEAPLDTVGRALQDHAAFPSSCNVGFAEVVDAGHVRLRVLERGAGETRACGSGACAAVCWLARQGRVGSRVRVTQAGGTLWVETDRGAGPVTLEGPAAHVFEGTLE
jgi:diaminopimelate epimerase